MILVLPKKVYERGIGHQVERFVSPWAEIQPGKTYALLHHPWETAKALEVAERLEEALRRRVKLQTI